MSEPPIQHNRVVIRLCFSSSINLVKPSTLRKIILRQTDHIIDRYWEIEFCDPRIQSIKQTIEEMILICQSLYLYG
jgi:hypothetical protein